MSAMNDLHREQSFLGAFFISDNEDSPPISQVTILTKKNPSQNLSSLFWHNLKEY